MDKEVFDKLNRGGSFSMSHEKAIQNGKLIGDLKNTQDDINLFIKIVESVVNIYSSDSYFNPEGLDPSKIKIDAKRYGENSIYARWDSPPETATFNFSRRASLWITDIYSIFEHEAKGHGGKGWGKYFQNSDHPELYYRQSQSPIYPFLSPAYKEHLNRSLKKLFFMKKIILLCFLIGIIIFSCSKSENNDISLNVINISLNDENNDHVPNTLILFDLNLINNSPNELIFIATARDDVYRKSRLILMDTVSHKSIDIITGDVDIIKRNSAMRIYGYIDLLSGENNQSFFYGKNDDENLIKEKDIVFKKINNKLKSCKIYYIQNEKDLIRIEKGEYKNIVPIKDSLKVNENLYIH